MFIVGDDTATIHRRRDRTSHARHGGRALTRRQWGERSPSGGGSWIRTRDIPGMNRLLYHLS